ncbi:RNA polymerase sigma-70 factor (ECF subfamily) [Dysgonomonas hofstadii]|uniref:RNA polymerase sigma-70 factor (ECF subfamily) n=1 Tax=Dysgonomonas hofstadii TaxID=637886 RepID=A0A840CTL2_9BACT|nr:RNA polymerase sigma-70 factor [Dysgonomonas hofstadii]MBB4036195.1 RNA polymerase sigma-70 factor (ECF subfamily) [Dysgonomonas hofstadii]
MKSRQMKADNSSVFVSFKLYYDANVSHLILFANRFVPIDTAKDLIHDLFLEIWENLDSFEKLPTRSYLFKAVKNRCINYLKREQVRENYISYIQVENKLVGLEYYDSFEKLLVEKEGIQEIYNQIEALPDKCKQIFKLAYFEDKKNAEIAIILGLSVRTVEHQLYLGLKTLRDKLQPKRKNKRKFFIFF